jgi:peptide/nickel transport system permease protein
MIAFILRSLLQGALVLVAVAFIAFSMFRFVGDPVTNMVGQEATLQDRAELTQRLGLDQPFPISSCASSAMPPRAISASPIARRAPVSALIAERLPATVELAVLSALFATIAGWGSAFTPPSGATASSPTR